MPKEAILCYGFERCGTTTLYEALSGSTKVNFPKVKEPYIFTSNFDLYRKKGREVFFDSIDDDKYYVDFSPNYHLSEVSIERIKKSFDVVKIILCVREPVARAFSFYHHVIYYEILGGDRFLANRATRRSKERFEIPFDFTFQDIVEANHRFFFPDYTQAFSKLREAFGEENIHIVVMEEDLQRKELNLELNEFLSKEVFPKRKTTNSAASNSKKPYSLFLTDKCNGWIRSNDKIRKYRKNDLIVFRGQSLELAEVACHERAQKFFEASNRWTWKISAEEHAALAQTKLNSIEEFENEIGRTITAWRVFKELSSTQVSYNFYKNTLNIFGMYYYLKRELNGIIK